MRSAAADSTVAVSGPAKYWRASRVMPRFFRMSTRTGRGTPPTNVAIAAMDSTASSMVMLTLA